MKHLVNTNRLKVTTLSTLQLASTNLLAVTTWVTCNYKEEEKEKKQTNKKITTGTTTRRKPYIVRSRRTKPCTVRLYLGNVQLQKPVP